MPSTHKCEYCGSTIRSDQQTCPQCGAPNPNYVAETERRVFLPKTIEELKEYCAERGMPLLRMRFFIGENFQEPKAFGIYQSGNDFIVYKNKANGQRAIRYQGPDEEYAVNELFMKLLDECHRRGIYPDGRPSESESRSSRSRKAFSIIVPIVLFMTLVVGGASYYSNRIHAHDGYYNFGNDIYYHYGNDWYVDDADIGWVETEFEPGDDYLDYYLGEDFTSDWGVSDFKESRTWEQIQEDHSSSSSDYDSWDSSDTDWDSDW